MQQSCLCRRAILLAGLILAVLLVTDAHSTAAAVDGRAIKIALIGDSTVASYPRPPADRPDLTGWGQVLGEFFDDEVEVFNFARSGRSSKSFLRENLWQPVLEGGPDYVFIQFGHNDQPGKGDRSTNAAGEFQDNLKKYIRESREAGAEPILVTPVARRTFTDGKLVSSLEPYVAAMLQVGSQTGTPVIDLHQASFELLSRLGDEGSRDLSPSDTDRTHFSRKGARTMARLVAERIPQAAPALRARLRSGASR